MSRKSILRMLDEERQLILQRHREAEGLEKPLPANYHLPWYLEISKQWGIQHMSALEGMPPGRLLDIGAFYGLLAGVAYRMGWQISAVDVVPVPAYSTLRVRERNIECGIYNACTDTLPYGDEQFDVVLLSETLEHLNYSPLPMLREIRRVLKPSGVLLLSTPNPSGLGKLIQLARGIPAIEPTVEQVLQEGGTVTHKGLTFFENLRESKIWTAVEIGIALERAGMRIREFYYYGNTVPTERMSMFQRIIVGVLRLLFPFVKKLPIAGGSIFVCAERLPATGGST